MYIKILSNSEDVSVWIIEPAKVMQYKCFSHSLLDFSHLFFILGKPNPKEESHLKMPNCRIGKAKWNLNSLQGNALTCIAEREFCSHDLCSPVWKYRTVDSIIRDVLSYVICCTLSHTEQLNPAVLNWD